jgi:hypothetical protein
MRRRARIVLGAALLLLTAPLVGGVPSAVAAAAPSPSGSFALSDADAAAFQLPADVVPVWSATYPDGTVQTRYQQRSATRMSSVDS